MFLTDLEDFDYKPYIKNGEIVRGKVITEAAIVWSPRDAEMVTILSGFVTDLASLPWLVQFMLKKLGKHQRSAVLHDYLYRNQINNKSWADQQFNDAMMEDGVANWRRRLIMSGLFVGGWVGWMKHEK